MRGWPLGIARSHGGLLLVLAAQAVVFWTLVGRGSSFATASVECGTGTLAEVALAGAGGPWGPLDAFDGGIGGWLVAGMAGLPIFATLGVTALASKLVAWGFAVAVPVVVHGLLDRYESRRAALLGAAAVALGPPALLQPALIVGNYHWTGLLFDYGVAFGALALLEVARRPEGPLRAGAWFGLGVVTGVGLTNTIGSAPFLLTSWAALAVGSWRGAPARWFARVAAATGGVALGVGPLVWKVLVHEPFGVAAPAAMGAGPGMFQPTIEVVKLLDVVGTPLAWALHMQDAFAGAGPALGGLWLGLAWAGVALAVALRPGGRWGGAVPLAFVGIFVLVYVAVGMRIEVLPPEFSNLRETTHRHLPPLIAALAVGGAVGWARAIERLAGAARGLAWAGGGALGGLGGLAALGLAAASPPSSGVSAYRASCFDVGGFIASPWFREDPAGLQARCAEWSLPGAALACRVGAAWGHGYSGGGLGGADVQRAPRGQRWEPVLDGGADRACDALPAARRGDCLRGMGWSVGQLSWGLPEWPHGACEGLRSEADREGCWRGLGFPVGDHLHPNPARLVAVLQRVPAPRRGAVAQGVGYSIGRIYSDEVLPRAVCGELAPDLAARCEAGVREAAAHR